MHTFLKTREPKIYFSRNKNTQPRIIVAKIPKQIFRRGEESGYIFVHLYTRGFMFMALNSIYYITERENIRSNMFGGHNHGY